MTIFFSVSMDSVKINVARNWSPIKFSIIICYDVVQRVSTAKNLALHVRMCISESEEWIRLSVILSTSILCVRASVAHLTERSSCQQSMPVFVPAMPFRNDHLTSHLIASQFEEVVNTQESTKRVIQTRERWSLSLLYCRWKWRGLVGDSVHKCREEAVAQPSLLCPRMR